MYTLLKSEQDVLSDRPKGWHLTKVVRFTYVSVYVCVFIPICKQYTQLDKEEKHTSKVIG